MARNRTVNAETNRLARVQQLKERIVDLVSDESAETVATDLVSLALSVLASKYPGTLTASERKGIHDSYPEVTDALIDERALSEHGLELALKLASQLGQIAVSYSGLSQGEVGSNEKHTGYIRDVMLPRLSNTFDASVERGLPPGEAASLFIWLGTLYGINNGVTWSAASKLLFENVEAAIRRGNRMSPEESEENLTAMLMVHLGMSREEARKHAAEPRQQMEWDGSF